ncbi:NADPH-dependent FMN reductase [Alicyclobacillus dauci]|uniref:NAD(P)H-dependent oxidoreductase n=1 Tax=Alicyclobacillus dauci TaxID=1475485 RepID=A0ABY6ZAI9_9BACL|nr:NADPH-dependent FMN reductase [Alicyclobacillus dauci]WAH39254.1 NAD(P)H-dependent oxidoreductase [Alicyclobacillus dauci]
MNSPLIKILAISGSLRNRSSNSLLMRSMVEMAPRNANVTIYDELGLLPHFNPDLDGNDVPLEVNRWRNHLREADGVFICTPEYAKGVPGTLKNALDWVVSSGEFYNKPVAIVSASPHPSGGEIAHASLLGTLSMMNAIVAEDCSLKVPLITMKLSPDGSIIDEQTKFEAQKLMDSLIRVSSK